MRSTRLVMAALMAAVGIGLAAQGGVEKAQADSDAAMEKGGAALSRWLADDFTWVGSTGRLRDKRTVVNELQPSQGSPGKNVGIDVRPYTGGALMVFTRHQADGTQARVLRVWVQRGNGWQLVAHQGTPVGDKPVPAATNPSSPLPPNSGPAAEIKAIEAAISSLAVGNSKGDTKNFAASVTDAFVAVGGNGIVSKQDRIAQLAKRPDAPAPAIEETRTRIYGDLAVTNRVVKNATGRLQQTLVHAKQGGRWLRAAIISTPIATGKI